MSWLSVYGVAFGGVLESWPGVLSALLWFLVPAFRGSPGFVAGEVVLMTVRPVPFVWAVWLLRQGSVALVTVVCWGLVPVVAVRW